ncbi:caspase family protein [Chlamydiia bacterium]|nr:caspase family protein [Chlamydiia bacterium]
MDNRIGADHPTISRRIPFLQKNGCLSAELTSLLRRLKCLKLTKPLRSLRLHCIKQVVNLNTNQLNKEYSYKANKLMSFIKSPWLEKYKKSANKDEIICQFEQHVHANMLKAFRYVRNCENIPSPINSPKHRKRGLKRSAIYRPLKKLRTTYDRKTLVSFGINNYSHWQTLENAATDAEKMTDVFANRLGFHKVELYKNKEVTKDTVHRFFKDTAPRSCFENDLLVVSFHGHGHTINYNGKDYGFLVPYNAPTNPTPYDLISMDEIAGWLKYVPSNHILILLDACFSGLMAMRGAIPKKKEIQNNENDLIYEIKQNKHIDYHLRNKARYVINAGHSHQLVSDGGWGKNSIFTGAIISSDLLTTHPCSVHELYQSVHDTVVKHSPQIPTIGTLPGHEGGELYLGLHNKQRFQRRPRCPSSPCPELNLHSEQAKPQTTQTDRGNNTRPLTPLPPLNNQHKSP